MRGAFGTKDRPPAGFTLDSAAAPNPPAGFELDAPDTYEPTPVPNTHSGGLGKAIVEGAKQTGRALGTAFDVVTGDEQDIYEDAKVTPDQTGAQQRFHQALTQRKDEYGDDSIWQGIKNVAGAVTEEPMGAFQEVGAQLPNSAAVMGGMFAGAKIGAAAGPVGAIVGGIAGLLLGNTAMETGYIAQDQAREGNLDTDKALAQGAIKGGVITGIDAATIGLNKLMFGAPGKAAAKASQEAVEGILAKAGIDMADHAAVTTALRLDPGLKTAVLEGGKAAYIGALPGKLKKAAQAAAAMGTETVSEGAGEYLGSAAAGLDASFTEAVMEGLMSIPQSAGEAGLSALLAKRGEPGFSLNVPEDPNAPWDGFQVDEVLAGPDELAAFAPFPGTEGIQVEEVPNVQGEALPQTPLQQMAARFRSRVADMQAGQGEPIAIDSVPHGTNVEPMSPVEALQQRGEDELAARLDKIEKTRGFEQAEQDAAPAKVQAQARKERELDDMAAQARYERELTPLQQMAARIRNKTADLAGERARVMREREEAEQTKTEQPSAEGIEVAEEPLNSAMADALSAAGVTGDATPVEPPKVKLTDAAARVSDKTPDLAGERARLERERQEAAQFPDEIRPTSGKPYKSQASAENIIKIRKLKGYTAAEADGGWVLKKVSDADTAGVPEGPVPGDETADLGDGREGAGPLPPQGGVEGQSGPGTGAQITTDPGTGLPTRHPYEDELESAVSNWSKRHDDAYKARPAYADEEAAFRQGFEDRAAGRDATPGDLKYTAKRDYELGYSMGKYGAEHYTDGTQGRGTSTAPVTTGPSGTRSTGGGTSPFDKDPNEWTDDDIEGIVDAATGNRQEKGTDEKAVPPAAETGEETGAAETAGRVDPPDDWDTIEQGLLTNRTRFGPVKVMIDKGGLGGRYRAFIETPTFNTMVADSNGYSDVESLKDFVKNRLTGRVAELWREAYDGAQAGDAERRHDAERRKRVDEMTQQEMRRELLTDHLTGLGNRRAYDEDLADQPDAIHAYMDVDALKWVNDNLGHTAGDELLKAMGAALLEAVADTPATAYHLSGDEFVVLASTEAQARAIAEKAQALGATAELEATSPDGTTINKTGVEFSYGIGQDLQAADAALQRHKGERERTGERPARGETPRGVAQGTAEGQQAEVQGAEEDLDTRGKTIVSLLKAGRYADAYRLAKERGSPLRYGYLGPDKLVPYAYASDVEGLPFGIEAFVGINHQGKWVVIELESGYGLEGPQLHDKPYPNTREGAIAAAKERKAWRKGEAFFRERLEKVGRHPQAELEAAWLAKHGITAQDGRTVDEAASRNGEKAQEGRRGTTRATPRQAGEKQPAEPRSAADVAKELFGNTSTAVEEALTGLSELFGVDGSTKLRGGFPGDFNEETYAKAKPHFAVAWEAAKAAAGNVKELMEIFLDKFVAAFGEAMRPYLIQWIKEHRAELSDFQKEKGSDLSQQPEGGTALTQAFVKALEENRLPGDNRALRKFVSEQLGGSEVDNARLKVAQEELEAAIAIHARNLIAKGGDDRAIYEQLVALYDAQPNLSIRTSGSIERQAYSTPAPLAFAAALTAKTRGAQVYEPSAGNGLLLIDTRPDQVVANELDGVRARNLQGQGFKTIQSDAVSAVPDGRVAPAAFDSVIANPPFGKAQEPVTVQGYKLEKIEHIIAARSLLAMKSDGRATLILAADKVEPGAIQGKDRVFYNWLYANYNVVGNFEVDGKLYSRQGASWPVRVISVAGRNVSDRIAPASLPAERVSTWEGVYEQAEPIASAVVDSNISDAEFIASIAGSVDLKAPEDRNGVSGSDGEPTGTTGTQGGSGNGQGGNNGRAGPDGSGGRGNGGRSGGATADGGRGERGDKPPGLDAGEPAGAQPDGRGGPGGDAAGGRAGRDERALNSDELQAKYRGVAQGQYQDEGVLTPVNMRDALHQALTAILDDVGSLEEYVRQKLGYDTLDEVTADLMGLQIDTVAAAIYNIEHGTGVVIADQTGVGKGRQAAAIIRYAQRTGRTPIFATKGPDLFTDMYRDLSAIGSGDLVPFIMNSDVKINDEDGELVVHKSLDSKKIRDGLDETIATGKLPAGYDMLFFSYPQIQNPDQARRKIDALEALAEHAILVLDESHEAAGGSSNRGEVMRPLVNASAGVVYLSATFAKRADTMGLYFRTVLGKMVDSVDELVNIMATGGDQLQAILSNTLSRAGQLFRRERSFEGIDTLEVRDTDNAEEHARQADEATRSLRDIIRADALFKKDEKKWKQWLVDQGYASVGKGNKISETVTKTTFASVAHNYIRQLMLGLKAETAADRAIAALKRGERPTIALEHTMGSFLAEFVENRGAKDGDELTGFDYRYVLARGLARSRRIKISTRSGQEDYVTIPLEVLSPETIKAYEEALATIKRANVGIPVSPIDWIRQKLADAGYSSKEITNRNLRVDYSDPEHPKLTTRDSVEFDKVKSRAEFNSGLVDVLIMNVSGATGASLHSSEKFKDQRRRMMIVAQPMADINMFMQMLGRINRTGQVSSRETVTDAQALPKGAVEAYGLPYYELLSADLPAEVRPTAILMKKMKSLNANVSSNTDSANTLDSALDLFNKYGDQVVLDYLRENKEMGELFGPMIGAQTEKAPEDFAAKVTGKLALLPVQKQIEFYDDVAPAYQSHIDYLDSVGQNDLRISIRDLKAKPIGDPAEVIYQTPAEIAYIVPNAFLGKYEVAKLTHPPTPEEVETAIATELDGLDPEVYIEGVVVAKEEKEALYAEHLQQEKDAAEKDVADAELSNDKRNQAQAKAARMAAERELLPELRKTFRREMNDGFRPGTIYNVDIDGQLMSGVVTKVKDVSKPNNTNPYAESKTEVTFMVNGDIRHFKMPLSKLKSRDVLQGKSWRSSIASAFSEKQAATSTEERYLLTGNILGGLSRLEEGQKREIAYVTMDDGEIVPAAIMPLSFNPGSGAVRRDVSLRYQMAIVEFLDAYRTDADISRFGVASSDNTLRIIPTGAIEYRVRVPSSKAAGGKWHQNKRLTDITGEFVSSSKGFMDATVNADQLERMLEIVLEQVAIYAPESQSEKAQPFVDKHAPRHSRGRTAARAKADVRTELKALLTPNNALLKSGRLRVVQSDSDLPGHLQVEGDGVKGVVDPVSGKIYLVADNIGSNVKGVFLHEVGVHAGLKNLLGDKYQDVIRQMRGLRAIKKAAAVNAYAQVPDGTLEAHVDEEALAYLVEDTAAVDMSIVKKVLAAVRAWLFRHGILVKALTPEDMLALAAAAARSYAKMLQARPVTTGEAVQPQFSRLGDVVDRYRDARRAEPVSEYQAQNRKIREQNRPMWNRAKQILKRQLAPGGLLPDDVFNLKIQRDAKFDVAELDIRSMLAHYEDAVKAAYNMPADNLPDETQRALRLALSTADPANYPVGIPQPVADHIYAMRQYIDRMSVEYASILFTQATALQAEGRDAAAAAKAELLNTIAGNIGRYVNRSYRAFDDPTWPKKVPDEVLDDARRYLMEQYEAKAAQYDEWQAKALERGESEKAARHAERAAGLRDPERPERTLQTILKEGTAFDSMEGFIKESKLGAKDLSILKHRKDIAAPIRALLGEYIDPRINFAKSATNMNRLIFNQRFLDKVLEIGRGAFLFGADDRPADAWKKIAAPSTEAYSPLAGFYTFPEVEQAFRDALGKEQMADWYRTVVKVNGLVKYGKTVLSPTTAMRNWMSAMFFAVANGHFDAGQIRHSVKSLKEYFTHKGEGLAYLRKLKNLGVIYDTPYAGEMMRLLQESRIEDTLAGGGHLGIKRALDMATRFYQFGDDFWKIMGFENEVNLLIKHKGLPRHEAELQAAERIRNTYPTYSMVGQSVNKLRRFPLAGTFVSFPAEIIRTSSNMLRYLAQDMKDPDLRPLARRRIVGLAIAAGFAHGLQVAFMAMAGVDDDEEEAFRDLAAPWQRNANILPLPWRDAKGNLEFIDISFLDPYNYWKRPINAILRDQPFEDALRDITPGVFAPFFGVDIAAGAIVEAITNRRETGGRVFNPQDDVFTQAGDIANHLRKTLQPGLASNTERMLSALAGKVSPSGREYSLGKETAALFGFRVSTHDPRAALYYKSFEFRDAKKDATSILTSVARDPNRVDDGELKGAFERAITIRTRAYVEMARLVSAAQASGMPTYRVRQVLRQSGISKQDVNALIAGQVPTYRPSKGYLKQAVNKARIVFPNRAAEIEGRRQLLRKMTYQSEPQLRTRSSPM